MIHPTAEVSHSATVGSSTRIWAHAQICDGARVGDECIVGREVYIDRGVIVGNRVKIQTGAQLYRGTVIEDGVFIGPRVCLTNDKYPRAITVAGSLKRDTDWEMGETRIHYGASLGTGAIILPNVSVGKYAMIGAGAVVVSNVPDYGLVMGAPGRLLGYVCRCGRPLRHEVEAGPNRWACPVCRAAYSTLPDKGLCPM